MLVACGILSLLGNSHNQQNSEDKWTFFSSVFCKKFKLLYGSDFLLCFFAIYVQCQLIFSHRFLFIVTTYFGLSGHQQVYRLFWWRNLLAAHCNAVLLCYVIASDSSFCGLSSCFIWVSLNNCYAHDCIMVLLVCGLWLSWMFLFGQKFVVHSVSRFC
jgi:hypothetical protein